MLFALAVIAGCMGEPEILANAEIRLDVADQPSPVEGGVLRDFPAEMSSSTIGGVHLAGRYDCAPEVDETGPERWWSVDLPERGVLSARLDDGAGDGIDVDVHLLRDGACIARDDARIAEIVEPGRYDIVVDTWLGDEHAGPFTLRVDFVSLSSGPCAVDTTDLRMYWEACAEGIDCLRRPHDNGREYAFLRLPTVGPVVKEAHLVARGDAVVGWPLEGRLGIEEHYARSEQVSGFSMRRTQPWAPSGEGGSRFGQGSTGARIPPQDEAWYVNMYWRDRPAPSTRMILINPYTGAAAVGSAGYETGPGSNAAIGGASEELHQVLGSVHRDPLVMGFAVDQSLPLGPLSCP